MKKLNVLLLLVLVFVVVVAGCSSNTNTGKSSNGSNGTQGTPATTPSTTPEPKQDKEPEKKESDFPKKPIELIIPYNPGGSTDSMARILTTEVNKHLPNGQSVVIVNKPGGAATIGTAEVASATPDGYKLLLTTESAIAIQPHFGQTPYNYDDLQTVMMTSSVPILLAVSGDAPWQTFDEWLDFVKANPDKFTYATAGTGGQPHIILELLNQMLDIKTKSVPFDGAAPAITAVMGGHAEGTILSISDIRSQLESGDLRVLLNVSDKTTEEIKDIPMARDLGIDINQASVAGIFAPKGLPEDVLDILHEAFKKAIETPEVIKQFNEIGVTEPAYANPDDFGKVIAQKYSIYGEVLKATGMID